MSVYRNLYLVLTVVWMSSKGCVGVPPPEEPLELTGELTTPAETDLPPYVTSVMKNRTLDLKSKFVYQGSVSDFDEGGHRIQVDATMAVSDHAHDIAACTIKKMTQYMPKDVFNRLATTKIGIFTKAETLVVYPEFAEYANPVGCGTSCSGRCHKSCTFDGRKWYKVNGASKPQRTVILDDNILCNAADPHRRTNNIVVHECGHAVKHVGISPADREQVKTAYNHAKEAKLWADDYPMATVDEYFAVGSAVYFNVDHKRYRGTGNHINLCNGKDFCASEYESRTHLYNIDRQLYRIMIHVFSNNNPSQYAKIGVCGQVCT